MKVAFSTWKNRISPVFDVSREIYLVQAGPGQETIKEHKVLPDGMDRCLWIVEQGANFLVCGAISSHLQTRLEARNIQVVTFVAGDISEIIDTWLERDFRLEEYNMPGCCFRMNSTGRKNVEVTMRVRNQRSDCPNTQRQRKGQCMVQGQEGGKGQRDGQGRGQGIGQGGAKGQGGAQGLGREQSGSSASPGSSGMGRSGSGGAAGVCTCPKCGHQAPHERGKPCMDMKCPECGEVMRGRV